MVSAAAAEEVGIGDAGVGAVVNTDWTAALLSSFRASEF